MTKVTTAKSNGAPTPSANTETVAEILERERDPLIHEWLGLVEKQEDLMGIPLSYEDRTGHLPQLLANVIARLHLDSATKAPTPSRPVITAICAANKDTLWPWWWRNRDCCRCVFSPLYTSTLGISITTGCCLMW